MEQLGKKSEAQWTANIARGRECAWGMQHTRTVSPNVRQRDVPQEVRADVAIPLPVEVPQAAVIRRAKEALYIPADHKHEQGRVNKLQGDHAAEHGHLLPVDCTNNNTAKSMCMRASVKQAHGYESTASYPSDAAQTWTWSEVSQPSHDLSSRSDHHDSPLHHAAYQSLAVRQTTPLAYHKWHCHASERRRGPTTTVPATCIHPCLPRADAVPRRQDGGAVQLQQRW
jgi:hypothetical protein